MNKAKANNTSETVLRYLVDGDYPGLLRLTVQSRLSADDIKCVIQQYGRRLVLPPVPLDEVCNIVAIHEPKEKGWSVHLALWTEEEGRSDH